ncbi:MAG: ATP-binding cassette domain-containing protein [Thermoanaerobaculia bacterium]|nr:ATP-binding cassette domain-containing protein [Thermoanaerobaculia bacterium]
MLKPTFVPAPPILKLTDATVYRGDTRVFDRLSLEIPADRSSVVLGPNGAGKTTLLQLVTRDLYPVHRPGSSVEVMGRSRWNVAELRHELGIVSQELHLRHQRQVTGLDVVVSGFFGSVGVHRHQRVGDTRLQVAQTCLERLRIAHLAGRRFTSMSAGEQRRCLLARALVSEPGVLLLDEPTVSLDLASAFELVADLRRLIREGRHLVLVTHHLQEIPPEVSWAVLLDRGRVVAQGPKSEVLQAPTLSQLFGTPLRLVESDGFYQALPA